MTLAITLLRIPPERYFLSGAFFVLKKSVFFNIELRGYFRIIRGMNDEKLTPAQKQYMDMKRQYKDCILFFRMGDFYEVFYEDAKICSKLLDLTLTSRDKNSDNPIPMAGVPYHSAEKYIAKLVALGYKVAIGEQVSEPKAGQIVQREVTSVITPGTYIQESQKQFSYIAAVAYTGGDLQNYHLARGDFSVGQYRTQSFSGLEELLKFLVTVSPAEIVVDIDLPQKNELESYVHNFSHCLISTYDQPSDADLLLQSVFGIQSLTSFGKALEDGRKYAFSLLVHYLRAVQK